MAFSAEITDYREGKAQKGLSHEQYRRARRHSWMVRAMKFLFPLIAVLVMAGFFWASIFNAMLPDNFHIDKSVIEDGKLVMSDPVLTGENANGQVYRLTAKRAIQPLKDANNVTLVDIHATFPVSSGQFAKLTAKHAVLDRSKNIVTFDQPFRVLTDDGMDAKFQGGRFDIGKGTLVTAKPIDINSPRGSIVARSMRMSDKGSVIEFQHNVRMTLQPSAVKRVPDNKANQP